MIVFVEFNWHIVFVFCVLKYSNWRPRWQQVGESHDFCYDTLHGKNNRLILFVMLFFVFVLVIVFINPYTTFQTTFG